MNMKCQEIELVDFSDLDPEEYPQLSQLGKKQKEYNKK